MRLRKFIFQPTREILQRRTAPVRQLAWVGILGLFIISQPGKNGHQNHTCKNTHPFLKNSHFLSRFFSILIRGKKHCAGFFECEDYKRTDRWLLRNERFRSRTGDGDGGDCPGEPRDSRGSCASPLINDSPRS